MKSLNALLLFILSISLIKTFAKPEFSEELKINSEQNFNINALAKYTIDMSQIENHKYILIEVQGINIDNNYVLSIVEDFDKQNRIQLAQSVRGITSLILSKEQIKGNTVNIILECSDYSSCSGKLIKQSFSKIGLRENMPLYYYNTIDNMVMEFSLKSTSQILNIWARGELEITTNLEGAAYTKSKNGNFYLVNNNSNTNEITLKVIGKNGDYINVGFTGYSKNNKESDNNYFLSSELIKDGYALTGFLNRNISNEYCYNFENFTLQNENICLSGIAFNNFLIAQIRGQDEVTSTSSIDGLIYFSKLEDYKKLCFSLPRESNESIFIFQIYSDKSLESKLNVLEPQSNSIFYSYGIKPGKKMMLISKISKNNENILYFLYSTTSLAYLYSVDCYNYPLCSLNDSVFNNASSALTIGKISSLNLKKEETYDFSPINKHQKLYVVKCDDKIKSDCQFQTLISSANKEFNINYYLYFIGRNSFKNQIDKYKINNLLFYARDGGINEFLIEISYLAGEVDIITDFPKEITLNRIDNLNKISLFIKMNNPATYDSLIFSVKNLDNSFYSISFLPIFIDPSHDILYSNYYINFGIPKLFSFTNKYLKDPSSQIIFLMNLDRKLDLLKTVNFNSLNCEIEVFETTFEHREIRTELIKYGNFYHDVPSKMKHKEFDNYLVKINNYDLSEYSNKVCQVYLSFINNLVVDSDKNYVDLLVYDNIPQQIMLNKNFTHASYGYYHAKPENDIIIKYSSKNKGKYIAKFYYFNKKREKEENIMGEGIIYLNHEEWENICKNKDCFIKIDITLDTINLKETDKTILEISFKALEEKKVNYITKGQLIKDYITYQKSQYYYTEIGKNEIGYVNAHFLKGSGEIFAKIVEADKTEQNPDWKGKYTLPTKENAEFKMDTFTKKLKFSSEKYKCENMCYLIINIFSDNKASKANIKSIYPYTIFVQSYPNNLDILTKLPIISIPQDEYIIGYLEKGNNKDIFDIYKTQLNLNSDKIIIDIHSTIEKVLVNIGGKRPNIYDKNFEFTLKNDTDNHDNIFIISKEEILKQFPNINLTNFDITIALYSSKLNDTITTIPYSFSIRLSNESGKDIYKINSEHLSLRNSKQCIKVGEKYQCFYLIKYDYITDISPLIISARNSNKTNKLLSIKAKYVDYEDYLFGKIDLNNFEFSNNENEKYILLTNGFMKDNKAKCIFVLVESSEEKLIQFYVSFYNNYNSIYIDPSSPSIKYVPKGESLSLYASKLLSNSIHFEHLGGKGEIYLRGKDTHHLLEASKNNFTLTLDGSGKDIEIIVKETSDDKNSNGFMFYLEQNLEYNQHKQEEENQGDKEGKGGINTTLIIIIVASVVGIIIIVGLIIATIKYKNKMQNIGKDISKISFEEDRDNNLLFDENKI